jgi:hypothetical protein
MISNDDKQKMMNGNVPFRIKLVTLYIGFILNDVAYITHPVFTNGASIAYAYTDVFFESEDYEFIEETNQDAISTAKLHEAFYLNSQ